jgi:uncharacterized protein (TIGR00255 family)
LSQARLAIDAEPSHWAAGLLGLPGVIEQANGNLDMEAAWPPVERATTAALQSLQRMRRDEGAAMQEELAELGRRIGALVDEVDRLAERSVADYRDRLFERVSGLLAEHNVAIDKGDTIRELTLLAERFDIAEEIARLRSHRTQFHAILESDDSVGRKLEFLTQELHREANTIGSKANDIAIANLVVDLKTRIERVREIVQNVE